MRFVAIQHSLIRSTEVLLLLALIYVPAFGQEPHGPENAAPPPLKTISRTERLQLNESKDAKARVRTTIELAEVHLGNAETETSQHNYDGAAAASGKYAALFEDVFSFLKVMDPDSNKVRDLYKRVELALRAHGPRLSAMRRSTPAEYAVWLKEIEDFARKGRTEALNSFYGHTVLKDGPPKVSVQKQTTKQSP